MPAPSPAGDAPITPHALALTLALLAAPTPGPRARTSSLSWVRLPGAEPCVGARALAEAVEARLSRRTIVSAATADLSIEGRVEPAGPERWRATIVASDAAGEVLGERVIEREAAECGALTEALALVIALMIDPASALAPTPPPPTSAPTSEPASEPASESTASAPTPPPPRPRLAVDLTAGYAASLGLAPGDPGGPRASVMIDPPALWPIALEAGLLMGGEARGSGGGVAVDQLRGGLFMCAPHAATERLRLYGCLGGVAGLSRARGRRLDVTEEVTSPLLEGAARVEARYNPASIWILRVGASLSAPLLRDRLAYLDVDEREITLFEPSAVGATLFIGLGVRLP